MNPFEALGEGMQIVGMWLLSLRCKVFGHKWETQYVDYAEANIVDGWFCVRCYAIEYYKRPAPTTGASDGG